MVSTSFQIVSNGKFSTSQIGRRRRKPLTCSRNGRQMLAKAFFVFLPQTMAVIAFLLGHVLENGCRVRITLLQVFGEGHINPAVFLLREDCNRQPLRVRSEKFENFFISLTF